jgi:hypothetical protein
MLISNRKLLMLPEHSLLFLRPAGHETVTIFLLGGLLSEMLDYGLRKEEEDKVTRRQQLETQEVYLKRGLIRAPHTEG